MSKLEKRRKTGGRKAGTPNRATAAKAAEIAASGQTPLEFMLSVMRCENESPERRLEAAKAAAPFVHPKLAAVDHSVDVSGEVSMEMSSIESARRIAFLLLMGNQKLDLESGSKTLGYKSPPVLIESL